MKEKERVYCHNCGNCLELEDNMERRVLTNMNKACDSMISVLQLDRIATCCLTPNYWHQKDRKRYPYRQQGLKAEERRRLILKLL